jgi:cyclopropane-fatty-acyl-phospholipid synthase
MPIPQPASSSEYEKAVRQLSAALRTYSGPSFCIRFWEGSVWFPFCARSTFTVLFKTEEAWKLFISSTNNRALAECFIDGDLHIDGDLYLAIRAYRSVRAALDLDKNMIGTARRRWISRLSGWIRFQSSGQKPCLGHDGAFSLANSEKSYEFHRACLGSSMVFSSAYFHTFDEDLEQAQFNGIEHICHKLRLNKGDRFLDLQCDWGSLLLHAASVYDVSGHGFCHDDQQVSAVELRIVQAGLHSQCEVQRRDYSDMGEITLPFDKMVNVSLSHICQGQLDNYFRSAYQRLRPGGLFLCDFVTCFGCLEWNDHAHPNEDLLECQLLNLPRILECAEIAGFSIRGVEDLTAHLEQTLQRWSSSITKQRQEIARLSKLKSWREWELYIACSAEALRQEDLSFYQILLSRNTCAGDERCNSQNAWSHYVAP